MNNFFLPQNFFVVIIGQYFHGILQKVKGRLTLVNEVAMEKEQNGHNKTVIGGSSEH